LIPIFEFWNSLFQIVNFTAHIWWHLLLKNVTLYLQDFSLSYCQAHICIWTFGATFSGDRSYRVKVLNFHHSYGGIFFQRDNQILLHHKKNIFIFLKSSWNFLSYAMLYDLMRGIFEICLLGSYYKIWPQKILLRKFEDER
jgi:hypothetical protein